MDEHTPEHAERAVLAAALLDPRGRDAVVPRVRALLAPSDFGDPRAATLWEAILATTDAGRGADIATVHAELVRMRRTNAVAMDWIHELIASPAHTEHVEHHAAIVRDASVRRELATIVAGASGVVVSARSAEEALARLRAEFDRVGARLPLDDGSLAGAAEEVFEGMEAAAEGRTVGARTGLRALDEQIAGFFGGDLVVIAADQSRGKTALALQCVRTVAEEGRAALVFSYEMPRTRVLHRIAQHLSGIGEQRVRAGQLDAREVNAYGRAVAETAQLPVYVFEQFTIERLSAKVRAFCARRAVGVVVVDYLQIVTPSDVDAREKDYARITRYSRELKRLAMECRVPIIAVSQFNRGGNKAEEPTMHDLKGSGAIESDADTILLIHAPDEASDARDVIVPKNRAGDRWHRIATRWDGPRQWFRDVDAAPFYDAVPAAHHHVDDDGEDLPPFGTLSIGDAE